MHRVGVLGVCAKGRMTENTAGYIRIESWPLCESHKDWFFLCPFNQVLHVWVHPDCYHVATAEHQMLGLIGIKLQSRRQPTGVTSNVAVKKR